ncbi:MAG: iron-sulfur cluster-binding protein [Anaerolineae bacterium]
MRQEHLRVLASGSTPSGHFLLEVDCEPLAQPARAGQFLMVRTGPGTEDALRHPAYYSRGGRIGQVLLPASEPWQRDIAALQPEETLDALGPLGQPFTPRPGANRVLILALAEPVAPALAAAQWAERQGCTVSVQLGQQAWQPLADLLPSSIECEVVPLAGLPALHQPFRWADQVIAVVAPDRLAALADSIAAARMRLTAGFASVLLPTDFACGVGACGGCAIRTRGQLRTMCSDGPFLDLTELL